MHQFFLSKRRRTSTTTLLFVIPMLGFRSSIAVAQQSLFNVPSANVTPKGELFFQEQLNFGTAGESNSTTDIGLGKGFEVDLNVMHVRLYPAEAIVSPDDPANDAFMINSQWIVSALPWLKVALGTEQGISAREGKPGVRYVGWGFGALRFEPAEGRYGGYVLGAYYGTKTWTGLGANPAGLAGFEIPVVGEHLALCADWMIGTNRQSVEVLGIQVMPVPAWGWQISLGAQLPGFGPDTGYAFVLELTHLGRRQEAHGGNDGR